VENSLDGGAITQDAGTLTVAAASDVGLRRSGNEDSHVLWVGEPGRERETLGALLVMADGMGGALAGEVAEGVSETPSAFSTEGGRTAFSMLSIRAARQFF